MDPQSEIQFYTYCLHCKLVPIRTEDVILYRYRGELGGTPCNRCDGEAILYSKIDEVLRQITLDELFELTK